MVRKYAYQGEKEGTIRVCGNDLRISSKHCVEIGRNIKNKTIKISICIALASLIVISLCGFRNKSRSGRDVEYTVKAQIIEIEESSILETKLLIVKQIPVKLTNEDIYVYVSDDTFIGFQNKIMEFDDLTIGMCIEIQGRKVVIKENNQEMIDVYARRITPLME